MEISETVKNNQFLIKSIEKNISKGNDSESLEELDTDSKSIQVPSEISEDKENGDQDDIPYEISPKKVKKKKLIF